MAKDQAFCYVCILHSTNNKSINFCSTGFNDWSHAMVAFNDHSKALNHIKCIANYKSRNRGEYL